VGRRQLVVEAIVWGKDQVSGRIEIDGRDLGRFRLESNGWNTFSFRLPWRLFGPEVVRGRILIDETWTPAEEGLSADTRQLGIAVRRIYAS
jgi:hypothetical protein